LDVYIVWYNKTSSNEMQQQPSRSLYLGRRCWCQWKAIIWFPISH